MNTDPFAARCRAAMAARQEARSAEAEALAARFLHGSSEASFDPSLLLRLGDRGLVDFISAVNRAEALPRIPVPATAIDTTLESPQDQTDDANDQNWAHLRCAEPRHLSWAVAHGVSIGALIVTAGALVFQYLP